MIIINTLKLQNLVLIDTDLNLITYKISAPRQLQSIFMCTV